MLASIQQVRSVMPIPGADNVELARILGWNVMVRKDTMQSGDNVVFFEIDSLLPDIPQFSFLKEKGFPYRLKTEKYFKGKVTSQGLALPLSDFIIPNLQIGSDVSDILGITKYVKMIDLTLGGDNAGSFPSYIPKTDEIRLQAFPEVLEEMQGEYFYATVKIDGTSVTYLYDRDNKEFTVCSRNWAKKGGDNVYWDIARRYNIAEILKDKPFAIQGEIAGPGIQKNPLKRMSLGFFIFDIFNYETGSYLTLHEMTKWVADYSHNSLLIVPLVWGGKITPDWTIEKFVDLAKGEYATTRNQREGIVIRSMAGSYSNILGKRFSVKVINPDYKD